MEEKKKSRRGFAGMDPEKHRAICRKGSAALAASGKRHKFSHELAVRAGRIGGLAAQQAKREAREAAGAVPTDTE